MMPPTSIDGTDITGATIDGQDVEEITIDGQTVFSAGPPPVPAGTHFYYIPTYAVSSEIEYYQLSTPFDVENRGSPTATFDPDVGSSVAGATAVCVRNDGTQILAGAYSGGDVIKCYNLSTPFDLSGSTSVAYTVTDLPSSTSTFLPAIDTISDDIFYAATLSGGLEQFSLSTPFDIRTRTSTGTRVFDANADDIGSPAFSPDGTLLTVGTRGASNIYQSTCSTPFDITTYDSNNENVFTTSDEDPLTVKWNGDGTEFFVRHLSPEMLDRYSVSTPYTLTGVSFETRIDTGANNGSIEFNYNI